MLDLTTPLEQRETGSIMSPYHISQTHLQPFQKWILEIEGHQNWVTKNVNSITTGFGTLLAPDVCFKLNIGHLPIQILAVSLVENWMMQVFWLFPDVLLIAR